MRKNSCTWMSFFQNNSFVLEESQFLSILVLSSLPPTYPHFNTSI